VGGIEGTTSLKPPQSAGVAGPGSFANSKHCNREPKLVQLHWSKSVHGTWWRFDRVEPSQLDGYGVFVVWRNGDKTHLSSVLYVGRGFLRDEFARARRDPVFQMNGLYITWATVPDAAMLDGIGAFLYRELRPVWGEIVPMVPPLACNLPLAG
jgi:hypothetical protein